MKVLVVSTFPPLRCGIGKYAFQQVKALRADGHEVEVLSPKPTASHYHEDLRGGRVRRIGAYARKADVVYLHFAPDFYYRSARALDVARTNLAFRRLFGRARNIAVVAHEVTVPPRAGWRPDWRTARWMWKRAPRVIFHTHTEAESLQAKLGVRLNAEVQEHGAHFAPAARESRSDARRILGLPDDAVVFLCIGFVQPHKGFDRALKAFASLPRGAARLYIVGSVRTGEREHVEYFEALKARAAQMAGAGVVDGYISDEAFDRWMLAADRVVLPYREIWSSGVLERARLMGTRAIVSRVGGLEEQAGEDAAEFFSTDAELAQVMARAAGVGAGSFEAGHADQGPVDVKAIMAQVRRQAALRRAAEGDGSVAGTGIGSRPDLDRMMGIRFATPVLLPSSRPRFSKVFTLGKRLTWRIVHWYMVPILDQVNAYHDASAKAIVGLAREVEELRSEAARLSELLSAPERAPEAAPPSP
ncbi:MAG: glycosyltransferase family 4 protein [Actinomycetota bacterium]